MSHPPGLALFLKEIAAGEEELEHEFLRVAERHKTDHGVHHVANDLASWSRENRERLATLPDAPGAGIPLHGTVLGRPMALLREKTAELLGRHPEPALLLLHDLRHLYLLASGNSTHWTAIGQAAQALRDDELLEVVSTCHGRTTRQVAWCNATLKELSAQALTAR